LPHFRAIETDVDFDTPLHGSTGPILVRRISEFDGCTASFVRSAGEAGYRWIEDLNGATRDEPLPTGVGAVPLNINGGAPGGPRARVPEARDGPRQPHPADQYAGQTDPGDRWNRCRCRVRGAGWRHRSDCRPNRVVRRRNWIRTPVDVVRRWAPRRFAGGR